MEKVKRNNSLSDLPKPGPDASGKMPPKDELVEAAVLGCLMVSKDAYGLVADDLHPQSFYNDKHRIIYEAIQQLAIENKPVDYLNVCTQLKLMGMLEAVGGSTFVMGLTEAVASTTNLSSYVDSLVLKATARDLISFSGEVSTQAFDETQPVKDTIEFAEKGIFEITQRTYKNDVVPVGTLLDSHLANIQKIGKNEGSISGVPTGWGDLDRITSGWQKSDLIVVAARPSMGKTAFVLSMARNVAVKFRKSVAVFDLEMSNAQLLNRLIMDICSVEGEKLRNGKLSEDEWMRMDTRLNDLKDAPFYIDDTSGLSIFELCSKARKLKREHNIELLIIDYLQLLNAGGSFMGRREQEVSIISRTLKNLARELDIPIIALSQLNRQVETREGIDGKIPQLSDLRESGAIEQDADIVCFIHRPEKYRVYRDTNGKDLRGLAQIVVAKHRNGATGDIWLRFVKKYARFQNLDEAYEEESTEEPLEASSGEQIAQPVDFNSSTTNDVSPTDDAPF